MTQAKPARNEFEDLGERLVRFGGGSPGCHQQRWLSQPASP